MEAPLVDTPRAPHPLQGRLAIPFMAAAAGGGSGAGVLVGEI
jgi:hypothetical protein